MGCCVPIKSVSRSTSKVIRPKNVRTIIIQDTRLFQDVYQIGKLLGIGCNAQVRQVIHRRTKARKSVKIFRKEFQQNPEQEIQILSKTSHPNIVKLYQVFDQPKRIYLVMEYCGSQLFDQILKRQYMDDHQAALIMKQIFQAVQYIHSVGIVHRDLKPQNILLVSQNSFNGIKIVDFGSATNIQNLNDGHSWICEYAAPEVFQRSYNEKCDLWSCGIIMYLLLSGDHPFLGQNQKATRENIKKGAIFSNNIWSKVQNNARDLISKLLCPVSQRFSASEALNHCWFQREGKQFEGTMTPTPMGIFPKLLSFQQKSKVKDCFQAYLVSQTMEIRDMEECKSAFNIQENRKSTRINRQSLVQTYSFISGLQEEKLQTIIQRVQSNDAQEIEYAEFVRAQLESNLTVSSQILQHMFENIESEEERRASIQELARSLENSLNSMSFVELLPSIEELVSKKLSETH